MPFDPYSVTSPPKAVAVKADVPLPKSVPLSVAAPDPPFPTGSVPVTPVLSGKPVRLVATPLAGVPRAGVTRVGDVANTSAPVPVSLVTAAIRLALDGVAKNVATPVPSPLTPVLMGRPVALVRTPLEGVPRAGVTSVGEVAKTIAPVPVSSVTAAIALALDGVAKNVATPVPNPETPVLIGKPVAFVSVPLAGVPKIGATSVGPLFSTTVLPVPVVVAALIAVPLPARAGALTVVVSVMSGVEVEFATVPAKPFELVTVTLETVPPPEK